MSIFQPYNEEKLIAECKKGNRKAQQQLYEQFYKRMYVNALRYAKTNFEAEDILQDSFVKVFENLATFKGDSSLEYWIKRIVIFTAIKHNRKKMDNFGMTSDIDKMDISQEPNTDLTLSNYNFKQLLEFIQQLAPRYQMIFNLYAIEGYQHKEIAEMLDITEGTSKSQYARAKYILQEMIAQEELKVYEKR
jgi:RNA polymerase sigma factor (sigma-70 family)